MTRQQQALAYLGRQINEWREQYRERTECNRLSDAEVKERMYGHAMWDDPPAGYTETRLADWSRGWLHGCALTAGNCAGAVEFALSGIAPDFSGNETINPAAWDLSQQRGLRVIQQYGFTLQKELNQFTEDTETRHYIKLTTSPTVSIATIEFVQDKQQERLPEWIDCQIKDGFQVCYDHLNAIVYRHSEEHAQYPLDIHVASANSIKVCHPSNYHFWSNVQAWEDSNDIIAMTLSLSSRGEHD